jgi:heme oxygenase
LHFYHFDLANRAEGDGDSKADGRRKAAEVKDWFRMGMDQGVGDDEDLKSEPRVSAMSSKMRG